MVLKARHSESLWLYLGYIFLLISYLNINLLLFRFFLIMGSVFLILNAIFFGYIWLDVIIYNFLMIVINVIYSIPLILPYIDIMLSPIEQRVYDNLFSKNIDKRTFKRILEGGELQFIAEKNYVTQQGSLYNGVILVAHIKKSKQLIFSENGKEIYREDKSFTWMGLIEYDLMRKAKLKNEIFKWPISIFLDDKKNPDFNTDDNEFEKLYPEPLYIYYFSFERLQKIYADEGVYVKNALHSVWLQAISHKILLIDSKISKFLVKERKTTIDSERQGIESKRKHFKSNDRINTNENFYTNAVNMTEDKIPLKFDKNMMMDKDTNFKSNSQQNLELNKIEDEGEKKIKDSSRNINEILLEVNKNSENEMENEAFTVSGFDVQDQERID